MRDYDAELKRREEELQKSEALWKRISVEMNYVFAIMALFTPIGCLALSLIFQIQTQVADNTAHRSPPTFPHCSK